MRTAALLFSTAIQLIATVASAVPITIHNADLPGEGFNDPTHVVPVGGNPGVTRGAQRLYLFQYAADMWGKKLSGTVPIVVTASFSAQGGTSVSAVLGYARPTTVHDDFIGAPAAQTWYVAGLANQLRGLDINDLVPGVCPVDLVGTHCPEIEANFNSDVDGPDVLGATDFYYGVDGNNGMDIDFLSVLLHEIGHGLGVLTLLDSNGVRFNGLPDAYLNRLEVRDALYPQKKLSLMADNQRYTAIRDASKLVWAGPATTAAAAVLTNGLQTDQTLKIYAPSTYAVGSSVSHVDTSAFPNELMEPYLNDPPPHDLTITTAMLKDIGWTLSAPTVLCGDANGDAKVTTADALVVLRSAVGGGSCDENACDVNDSGTVTSSDALLVLRYSVGQGVSLTCPAA